MCTPTADVPDRSLFIVGLGFVVGSFLSHAYVHGCTDEPVRPRSGYMDKYIRDYRKWVNRSIITVLGGSISGAIVFGVFLV